MNTFDHRWKVAVAAARRGSASTAAPFGFAARVLAHCQGGACEEIALLALWQWLAFRVLAALTLLLLLLIAYDALTFSGPSLLHPQIENAVPDAVFFL
jgi:hypothetical protein